MIDDENGKEDKRTEALVNYLQAIGVERFASEISEERFQRRILESSLLINSYDIQKSIDDQRQETIDQRILATNSQLFDKAASYNNIVTSLGYAGFFTIWNFVSGSLHEWDNFAIALLLGFSIMCFIAWTLCVAVHSARSSGDLAKVYLSKFDDNEEKLDAILKAENKAQLKAMWFHKVWPYVFFLTIFTGFGAGLMLLINLFCKVVGVEFSFYDLKSI